MDRQTGDIYLADNVKDLPQDTQEKVMEMETLPTPKQLSRGKVRRNEPCPCGSGKKFKKCCILKK